MSDYSVHNDKRHHCAALDGPNVKLWHSAELQHSPNFGPSLLEMQSTEGIEEKIHSEDAEMTYCGRLFQTWAAATWKAR